MTLPVNYHALTSLQRREVREEYIQQQGGLCWYCKAPLSGPPSPDVRDMRVTHKLFPPNFFKNPVHLHHNHDTGMTIGAVHARCNAIRWEYFGE